MDEDDGRAGGRERKLVFQFIGNLDRTVRFDARSEGQGERARAPAIAAGAARYPRTGQACPTIPSSERPLSNQYEGIVRSRAAARRSTRSRRISLYPWQ